MDGLDKERSEKACGFGFLESKALCQNPKSMVSSPPPPPEEDLHVGGGLVFGGLIWRDKSGCAGNNSIFLPSSVSKDIGVSTESEEKQKKKKNTLFPDLSSLFLFFLS